MDNNVPKKEESKKITLREYFVNEYKVIKERFIDGNNMATTVFGWMGFACMIIMFLYIVYQMFTHKKEIYAAGSAAYGAANRMGHSAMEGARGVGRSMNSMGHSAMQGVRGVGKSMSNTYHKGLDQYHKYQYNQAKAQLNRANQAMGQYGKYQGLQ